MARRKIGPGVIERTPLGFRKGLIVSKEFDAWIKKLRRKK